WHARGQGFDPPRLHSYSAPPAPAVLLPGGQPPDPQRCSLRCARRVPRVGSTKMTRLNVESVAEDPLLHRLQRRGLTARRRQGCWVTQLGCARGEQPEHLVAMILGNPE